MLEHILVRYGQKAGHCLLQQHLQMKHQPDGRK